MEEAIKFFENKKAAYDEWYMNRDKVSIAQIVERDDFMRMCDWAIKMLQGK